MKKTEVENLVTLSLEHVEKKLPQETGQFLRKADI
jgi:hypothetical protein